MDDHTRDKVHRLIVEEIVLKDRRTVLKNKEIHFLDNGLVLQDTEVALQKTVSILQIKHRRFVKYHQDLLDSQDAQNLQDLHYKKQVDGCYGTYVNLGIALNKRKLLVTNSIDLMDQQDLLLEEENNWVEQYNVLTDDYEWFKPFPMKTWGALAKLKEERVELLEKILKIKNKRIHTQKEMETLQAQRIEALEDIIKLLKECVGRWEKTVDLLSDRIENNLQLWEDRLVNRVVSNKNGTDRVLRLETQLQTKEADLKDRENRAATKEVGLKI